MAIHRIDLTIRNIHRYQQIINVFLRYGFGHLLDRLNLSSYIDRHIIKYNGPPIETSRFTLYERARMAFEELGPTFVKFGQILSLRSIALPEAFVNEMCRLQDQVAPEPFENIRKILEDELGTPIESAFSEFEEKSIASGSIAQIHCAKLNSGSEVVVKIRRPGIKKLIETDLNILLELAKLLEKRIPEISQYDPVGIVEQLTYTMTREIDFLNEARNIEIFQKNFKNNETVHIPWIYREYTTNAILTMERIHGIKISDAFTLKEKGYDLAQIAGNGANLILQQVFEFGFFHADPHPGNIFILPGNVIAPVDFGIIGILDEEMMMEVADVLIAVIRKDVDRVVKFFLESNTLDEEKTDIKSLRIEILDFLNRYTEIPLSQLDMKSLLHDLLSAVQKHGIRVRTEYLLLMKTLVVYEDTGRLLDPDFDMMEAAKPYIKILLLSRFNPDRLKRKSIRIALDYFELFRDFPSELRQILSKLRSGKLNVELNHKGLEKLTHELEKSSNRIAFSLVVGSLIIASSFLWTSGSKPLIGGYPVLGILGYFFALFMGFWLLFAIIRSGRL